MSVHTDGFARQAQGSTCHRMAGVAGVSILQALGHFLAGVAIAAFLLPEGGMIVLLSLFAAAAMKTLYNYLDAGRLVARDAGYASALMAGGVLCLCYHQVGGLA
ncbi:hypothetical protein [Allopusillimonas ginsengisoli]|uniref:hypothetical protein n=1 Tax=Allopusillimonas ginsengisoli TaxID=453575 RepID=UPI0010229A56|nr:hypothetical protein [Allopusillimonas ginsengisoli]TEA79943.1 hypothetical protein ERE07_03140 [Allopusillimonas ginsengisoli]